MDAEVTLSRECDATSLRNGKLYDARLQEYAVLGNSLRRGAEMARAQGPIINLPIGFTKAEAVDWKKGRIIGGAKIYDQRMMGIHIRDAYAHVMTSNALAKAINDRFVVMELGKRRGAAVPKDDGFIQIDLPRKYIHDPYHFLDVILHVGFLENDERRNARMEEAGKMLYEPTTARSAALQFEAMGTTGRKALMVGLASSNPEIRFYTAYSLAYLDEPAAIPVLESLAIEFPEFRAAALIGLTVIDHYDGRDSLERLLQHPDGEVRYGALIAMRKREDGASMISSRDLKDVVRLSEVPSQEPFIAVSLEEIPEIAIFGVNPPLNIPAYLEINPRIVIRPDGPGMLRMVHFQPDGDDYAQVCKADLVSVLDTLQQVGGTYNDMIHFIDDASRNGTLLVPVGMNPRPKQGRVHHRNGSDSSTSSDVMSQDLEEIHQVLSEEESKKSWWDVRRFWPTGKSE